MVGACSTYGEEQRCIQYSGGETTYKHSGVNGRIQLKGAAACTGLIWLRMWTGDGSL